MCKIPWCPYWFKIILDASYHIYFYQNQQIIRYPCKTIFVPSFTSLNIFCSLVQAYNLSFWYSRKGPSCSYKFGENLILQKRAIRLLIPFKPFRFHVVPLFNFLYFKTIYLIMHDVSNNVTPPNVSNLFTYSSKVHHHLRLAISILRTRELNVWRTPFQELVQKYGIVFPTVIVLYLNINLRIPHIVAFWIFWYRRILNLLT